MKRMFLFVALATVLGACALPGQAVPTAISLPTAAPTEPPSATQPPAAVSGRVGDTRTSSSDGMIQVFVPEGTFNMGGYDADAQPDEKPGQRVKVSAFWMDKVEVTNAMYTLCVNAGTCRPPREIKSASRATYYSNAEFADFPVIYVTWNDADTYCAWAGRRLPTEAEWEYTARGADYRIFPWGDAAPDNTLANFNFANKDTARVGSFPTGVSAFGALDMAGNVWEWVSDYYNPTFYQSMPLDNPTGPTQYSVNGPRKVLRGGSWADGLKELRIPNRGYLLAQKLDADPLSQSYAGEYNERTGFRCASR